MSPAERSQDPFASIEDRIQAAVRKVAAADADPTDPFRGLYVSDDLARELADRGPTITAGDRLTDAARRLGLGVIEEAALAVVCAAELDPRYGRLFAYLQDDVTRKLPSARLVARLLAEDEEGVAIVLDAFAEAAPLRTSGAVSFVPAPAEQPVPLADRGLVVAEPLAAFLLGAPLAGSGAASLRRVPVPAHDPGRAEAVARLRTLLTADAPIPVVVAGVDAEAAIAYAAQAPLLVADETTLTDPQQLREASLICALEGRRLIFDGIDDLAPDRRVAIERTLRSRKAPTVLVARHPGAFVALGDLTLLAVDVPPPALHERAVAWAHHAGVTEAEAADVAAKFRLSVTQVSEGAAVARLAARTRGETVPTHDDLDLGARQASSSRLGELAARLEPVHTWESIVLPDRERGHLQSIAAHLRHRDRVLQDWGYGETITRGHGLKALFAGESGTGKTMAAQVIAHDLGLELYRVDLATVVSKYIGETEKNLDRIFSAAEGSNAILFFDEADALFGKRSEVSDAHDRYANIETSYLLQRMEGYEGCVVLATNFQRNIDDAFLRRLDHVIGFPFPDEDDRRRIWALLLPEKAPLADDVDLDFLAGRFKLAGGAIRNCALGAAYLAAEEGDEIGMRHLVRAVALEYTKLGRLTIEADFEQYHEALQQT